MTARNGARVKGASRVSRPTSLVCPSCEVGELWPFGTESMRCESCGEGLSGAMLETLQQVAALPDALGSHACECGHPQMRRLPDGVFHCPACGSEVLPLRGGHAKQARKEA
jgi:ribosomal protein L37AE/L43A